MIALFFEVTPRDGQEDRYLEIAGSLRGELDGSGGIVMLNRYRSLSRPRTMLSHQLWQDEAALARWRANGQHYAAQVAGRREVFEDYRLRVGAVVGSGTRATSVAERSPSVIYNDPAHKPERWMTVYYVSATTQPKKETGELWRSVYHEADWAVTAEARSRAEGLDRLQQCASDPCIMAGHLVLVSRDYGLFDRGEAPQYFPPAKNA